MHFRGSKELQGAGLSEVWVEVLKEVFFLFFIRALLSLGVSVEQNKTTEHGSR